MLLDYSAASFLRLGDYLIHPLQVLLSPVRVCQQDYTRTTQQISVNLGWRTGPDKRANPGLFFFSHFFFFFKSPDFCIICNCLWNLITQILPYLIDWYLWLCTKGSIGSWWRYVPCSVSLDYLIRNLNNFVFKINYKRTWTGHTHTINTFFNLSSPHPSACPPPRRSPVHAHPPPIVHWVKGIRSILPEHVPLSLMQPHNYSTHPVVFPLCPLCSQHKAGTLLWRSCEPDPLLPVYL